MRFVKLMLKIWPELMVLLSSISYTIIRLVADVNKLPLPTWFDDFNIPTISLFLMVFILLYRSKEKRMDKFQVVDEKDLQELKEELNLFRLYLA